jgi:hypothetical protein
MARGLVQIDASIIGFACEDKNNAVNVRDASWVCCDMLLHATPACACFREICLRENLLAGIEGINECVPVCLLHLSLLYSSSEKRVPCCCAHERMRPLSRRVRLS